MSSGGVQNYLNTLIFAIVAKAVTVILLIVLFTKIGAELAYMIITIEVGMVIIIAYSLYSISKYEKKKREDLEKMLKAKTSIQTCPDYFTRAVDQEDSTTCINSYTTPDNKFTYKFSTQAFSVDNVFYSDKNKLTFADYCTRLTTTADLNNTAWTDLKEKCKVTALA